MSCLGLIFLAENQMEGGGRARLLSAARRRGSVRFFLAFVKYFPRIFMGITHYGKPNGGRAFWALFDKEGFVDL